ncbi:MAG: hypothetical protein L0Z62_45855 [Gemmataceae bacterium]|nr:hypothetical protein [Gemmataceae bacterium]
MPTDLRPRARWGLLALAVLCLLPPAAHAGGKKDEGLFKDLKYRLIGPFAGGRVSRSAGVPGDPLVYYAGTASGGVWKTTDGGHTWKPIFDDQPTSSIGAIAVAPSEPNIVYVGSGEANIRGNVAAGNGIYRSTDGGKNWKHVWKQTGQIGHLVVHPRNSDIAFAAVLGSAFGPNPERGVYRTTDGGQTWRQVLKKDADTGSIDVCLDPNNPRIVFASLWQARRRPWELVSGGPGSGLYRSTDGGDSWERLSPGEDGKGKKEPKGEGLPEGPWGRVGVAVAPSDSRRVYALIEAKKGGLYRSDNGGDSWELANGNRYLLIRPWYFGTVHVDPKNRDLVWCPSLHLLKSIDAGKTFTRVKGPHHVDHHDLWIDPTNPKRMIDSNDGGVDITLNGGETWHAPMLPICQFYHISVDNRVPYHVSGNIQDIGTASGPSNSLSSAGIQLHDWHPVGGGETGFTTHDPSDPNIVYAGEYSGYLSRYDHRTRQARPIHVYPFTMSGRGAGELLYRFQWTAPLLISLHDPKVVYHAANVLFRTDNAGKTWEKISPDLTRDDKDKQKFSGGPITGDNTGAEYYCTIFALAESPKEKGLLWAGSDDGLVHVRRPGTKEWANVTKNIPGIPEWGTVSCIETSPHDPSTAYVVVDNHRLDDSKPYLWKTSDHGKSWKRLSDKLPQNVYLHVVREDPRRKGLLYVGTETGVVYSPDDGATWQPLKMNLPTVAVHDLIVKGNDLVVGTNGRSIWILDDLTPVRTLGQLAARKEAERPETSWLGDQVQPAVRWRQHGPVYSTGEKSPGENPPRGAVIHYHLKTKAKKVTLEVFDSKGVLVRRLTSDKVEPEVPEDHPDAPRAEKEKPLPVKPGLHRVVWDLQHEGARTIKGAKVDWGNPRAGPLAVPGTYALTLTVDGKVLPQGKVEILPDPRVKIPAKELEEQLKLALQVRDDISRVTDLVEGLRSVRKQVVSQGELLQERAKAKELLGQGKALLAKLDALEEKLHNPKAEHSYDILAQRGGAKLYSQLAGLLEPVKDADGLPGQGWHNVYADQRGELKQLEGEYRELLNQDVARLNEAARRLELPAVIVPLRGNAGTEGKS